MKYLLLLFCFVFTASAYVADDTAKTILTDGSASDTAAAVAYVDGKNQDGWVMTIGSAGASYSWGSAVNFNITDQSWTVQGAATNNRPTITVSSQCLIKGGASLGKIVTVRDIKWRGTMDGIVSMEGNTGNVGPNYRITNCEFYNSAGGRSMFCEQYGLVDHCTFLGESDNRIWVRNTAVGWTGTMTFGTTNTVCIEDCTFNNSDAPGSVVMSQVLDGDKAMRVIFRYNTITNGNTETHGYTSGAGNEGLQVEIYKNSFVLSGNGVDAADWATHIWRGGTGVLYSNTVTLVGGFYGANYMVKFRAEQPEAYPAPHQPGQGLVSNNTLGRVPIYCWDNTWPGGTFSDFGTGEGTMVVDVDYFTNTPKPGYTALVYPHPLDTDGGGSTGGGTGGSTGGTSGGAAYGASISGRVTITGNVVVR